MQQPVVVADGHGGQVVRSDQVVEPGFDVQPEGGLAPVQLQRMTERCALGRGQHHPDQRGCPVGRAQRDQLEQDGQPTPGQAPPVLAMRACCRLGPVYPENVHAVPPNPGWPPRMAARHYAEQPS